MNTVGENLREERKKLGLSQEKMADLVGVKRLTQINYETGKSSPDSEYLRKILEIGADVNYILTGVRVEKIEAKKETVLTGEGTMLKGGGGGVANDENMSPKRKKMFELLERLDDDALDDAIYSTKKLVENCEMKVMLNRLMAQQGQRMAA